MKNVWNDCPICSNSLDAYSLQNVIYCPKSSNYRGYSSSHYILFYNPLCQLTKEKIVYDKVIIIRENDYRDNNKLPREYCGYDGSFIFNKNMINNHLGIGEFIIKIPPDFSYKIYNEDYINKILTLA